MRGLVVTPTSGEAARIRWLIDPEQGDAVRTRRRDVVVGTPTRLLAQMRDGRLAVGGVEVLVLDDCERLEHATHATALRRLARPLPADCHSVLLSRGECPHEGMRLAALVAIRPRLVDANERAGQSPTMTIVRLSPAEDAIDLIRAIFGDCADYRLSPLIHRE